MKKIFIILFVAGLFVACTEVDNYDEPQATLNGQLIDSYTGKPLQTEQPQGFYIRFKELSEEYPDAQYRTFWGKADGSFNNERMFDVSYEVFPYDGAFVQPASQTVKLSNSKATTLTFTVTPYLAINNASISFDQSSKVLTATCIVNKPGDSPASPTRAFVALTWNPNVSYYCHGDNNGVSGKLVSMEIDDSYIGSNLKLEVDCSTLTPGHTWYVRLGAISNKNNNRANYSEVFTFTY